MEGPKMKSTSFTITADLRDKITDAIKKAMKAALGHERVSELVPLDHRYSNRKGDAEKKIAGWTGYERYCDLKSGHTVCPIRRTRRLPFRQNPTSMPRARLKRK
jgi:hypothetical protein